MVSVCPLSLMRDGIGVYPHVKQILSIEERQNPMSQRNGQDQGPISIRDILIISIVILGPSWTTAYITESVVYVIPMLAVCTFVVAQLFSHKNKRLDEEMAKGKKGKGRDGKQQQQKDEMFDSHHTGDH